MQTKPIVKKITSVVLNVLMYLFLAICLAAILLSVTSKKDVDGASRILGYEMRYIRSSSMTKSPYTDVSDYKIKDLPIKTLIIVQTVPEDAAEANKWYSKLKKGDVLTFRYSETGLSQDTITHRLIADPVPNENGGYDLVLQGDNKGTGEKPIELSVQKIDTSDYAAGGYNYVIGKVVGSSYTFGLLVYAVKQPLGIVFIIIVPCVIIIIMEIIRIMHVLGEEKAQKAKQEKEKQDSEIEELKKQLAALQQGLAGQQTAPPAENASAPPAEGENGEPPIANPETPTESAAVLAQSNAAVTQPEPVAPSSVSETVSNGSSEQPLEEPEEPEDSSEESEEDEEPAQKAEPTAPAAQTATQTNNGAQRNNGAQGYPQRNRNYNNQNRYHGSKKKKHKR